MIFGQKKRMNQKLKEIEKEPFFKALGKRPLPSILISVA